MESVDYEEDPRYKVNISDVSHSSSGANMVLDVTNKSDWIATSVTNTLTDPDVLNQLDHDESETETEDERGDEEEVKPVFQAYMGQPFAEIRKEFHKLMGDGGVLKKIVDEGLAKKPKLGDTIVVDYTAYLDSHEEPFDSTYLRKKPEKYIFGEAAFIPGIKWAFESMRDKERAWFLLSPDYAYGPLGCGARIPGNSTLLYDVKLIEVIDRESTTATLQIDEEREASEARFTMAVAADEVRRIIIDANANFNAKEYRPASKKYNQAIQYLDRVRLQNDMEEEEMEKLKKRAHINLALVYLNLKDYPKCVNQCKDAWKLDDNSVKVMFIMAKALMRLRNFAEAGRHLGKALRIDPNNQDIKALQEEMKKLKMEHDQDERERCARMLGFGNNAAQTQHPPASHCKVDRDLENAISELENFAKDPNVQVYRLQENFTQDQLNDIKDLSRQMNLSMQWKDVFGENVKVITLKKLEDQS